MGYSHGLDGVAKRKFPCPCRESNSARPARSLTTTLNEISLFSVATLIFLLFHSTSFLVRYEM
jgi:hypothetical protein